MVRKLFKSDILMNIGDDPIPSRFELEMVRCLHCDAKYEEGMPIGIARMADKELIWWHQSGNCKNIYSIPMGTGRTLDNIRG